MLVCESGAGHRREAEKITAGSWNKSGRRLLSRRNSNHQSRLLKAGRLHYRAANRTEEIP
jgi:hypothetical protein